MNFAKDKIVDADGIEIPKEKFFFYTLENGYSFAIRASGTEPKIKFYAFAKEDASGADGFLSCKRARQGGARQYACCVGVEILGICK
ncbi:MAG: hypothetical protein ACLUKN_15920 [Bacilli bacterium]